MSNDEKQMRAISERFDEQMRSADQLGIEALAPFAQAGNIDRITHNPTQEGIGEG